MAGITFPKVGEKHRLVPLYSPDNVFGSMRIKTRKRVILIYSKDLEKVIKKELGLLADRRLTGLIPNP